MEDAMTEMLEKAARAACEANEEDWHAAQRVGVTDGYFKIARAVLMAVRSEVVADFDENCETVRVLDSVLSSEPTP